MDVAGDAGVDAREVRLGTEQAAHDDAVYATIANSWPAGIALKFRLSHKNICLKSPVSVPDKEHMHLGEIWAKI